MTSRLTITNETESNLETQSGFLIVLKAAHDRLTFAVRRRVGTPPTSQVVLTPDEVRMLAQNLVEAMPQSRTERISVGQERLVEEESAGVLGEMDLFMQREYPSLVKRKRKRGKIEIPRIFLPAETLKTIVLVIALMSVIGVALSYFSAKKSPAAKVAEATPVVEDRTVEVEAFARRFVPNLLDFKRDTYRYGQTRALGMMTPSLQEKHWKETGYPLSASQIRKLPAEQDVRVESAQVTVVDATTYEVDIKGGVATRIDDSSTSTPFHLLLTVKGEGGEYLVSDQKDLTDAK